ncbi:hypothetical protein MRX96_002265 [Rhipicephalus microplus]
MCDAAPTDGAESKRLELKPVCMAPRRGGGTVFKATDATARAGGSVAVDSAARSTMSKTFHRRSTAACGLVVLMLLLCSVGLLIAFLKGHQQQTRDAHMRQGGDATTRGKQRRRQLSKSPNDPATVDYDDAQATAADNHCRATQAEAGLQATRARSAARV